MKQNNYLGELIRRYPDLMQIEEQIQSAYLFIEQAYCNGKKLLIAGNGGSAADAEHIVGELMKSFRKKRPIDETIGNRLLEIDQIRGEKLAKGLQGSLPAIALVNHTALNTAYANDVDSSMTLAQQVQGYGQKGDVLLAISTSGNSENILLAGITAKAKGMHLIALTGKDGGELAKLSDVAVIVPNYETYQIQEYHLPIYHTWCLMLEDRFF